MDNGEHIGDSAQNPWTGRLHRLRRRPWWTFPAAAVVLAAAITVPIVTGEDEPECRQVPAAIRGLADDPAAATKALDPGDDLSRLDAAEKMLAHEQFCGDGGRVLGRVIDAATGASGPGKAHTKAQARSAYAVVAVLTDVDIPDGLAPGVARMLAEYVVDAARGLRPHDEVDGPVLPASEATLDDGGWTWLGRFVAPEAYAGFGYQSPDVNLADVIEESVQNPEAFAILYDAQRAYFAYYLERLTDEGGDPNHRPSTGKYTSKATSWPDHDLDDFGSRVGALMKYRARYARDGTITDLDAFDAAVRKHSHGTFRPADRRLTELRPMGRIAERPVTGPVTGPLMDGRYQLFMVLDVWAAKRDTPPKRAAAMRQAVDDGYLRGLL